MLYTIVPLERIYQNQVRGMYYRIGESEESEEMTGERRQFDIDHGFLDTKYYDGKYVIERIHSTNMADYLNEEYQPGCVYTKSDQINL